MHTIEETIDIHVPVRTAYDQWTQFEQFPKFMEGVQHVRQLDEKRLEWKAEILGKEVEWTAEITEQIPDSRVSWRSTSGPPQAGTVSFLRLAEGDTRITLRIDFDPQGAAQVTGTALGLVTARVKGDLKRFKEFIEKRGVATGQWRGEIAGSQVEHESVRGEMRRG